MCTQRTDPVDHGEEARKDDLKILIFDGARIKAKVFPYDGPNWLQIQLGRHVEAALSDIDLADALQNVARCGNRFSWILIDVWYPSGQLTLNSQ